MPAVVPLIGVLLSGRRQSRKIDEVKTLAEPMGNGFTKELKTDLADIREEVRENRVEQNRLRSEVSDIRADQVRHLQDHGQGGSSL